MPNRSVLLRVGLVIGLVVVIVAAGILIDQRTQPQSVVVNGRTRGDPNAKITLVEYGDFQ